MCSRSFTFENTYTSGELVDSLLPSKKKGSSDNGLGQLASDALVKPGNTFVLDDGQYTIPRGIVLESCVLT